MSNANLKSEGQKGNNYPWQFNVLDQLVRIKDALVSGTIVVTGTFTASSTQRTPTRSKVSTLGAGVVPAGFRKLTIETSDDFEGTILGTEAFPSRAYSDFQAQQNNDTVGAVAYNITSGYVIINLLT